MSNAAQKIIDGLTNALAGNFAAVTIEGKRWVCMEWRDMADAPKDGKRILYIDQFEGVGHCHWGAYPEDGIEDGIWWDEERDDEACPLFWMPELPALPQR